MPRKAKKKEEESIPRVKTLKKEKEKKGSPVVLDDFVKKKKQPLADSNDEARWNRQVKRAKKREKQRRNDVATAAEVHLEKALDSFQAVTVTGQNDVVMTDASS